MRVALLAFDFGEYSARLAGALADEADVHLLVPERHLATVAPVLDARVVLHPFHKPRLRQPFAQLAMVRSLHQRVAAIEPDIVHVQQGHLWLNLALDAFRGYRLVVTAHDVAQHPGDAGAARTPSAILRRPFRRADRVIVHAQALRHDLAAEGIDVSKVHVIPHIAIGPVETGPASTAIGDDVLFFGRIWGYKGLDYLIDAQPAISAAVPSARIVIAGGGEDLDRYRRRMHDPSVFEIHEGYIEEALRDELFARARVVVLPYIEASQSGVVPVAYAFARPVVATRVGGLPEVVDEGRTGYLVPPRDADALATRVIRLLTDTAEARRLGAAGRRKLETEWSPASVGRQTLAVYRALPG